MAPTTWAAECCTHVLWARGLIEMMHPAITTEDWSLMDCQEYFVDLEASLTGVATALEVSAPGQLRDDQMEVYRELELEVGVARGLANKLRARHLEEYDLRRDPAAATGPSGVIERLKAGRQKLDAELSSGREVSGSGFRGKFEKTQCPSTEPPGSGGLVGGGLAVVLGPARRAPVVQTSKTTSGTFIMASRRRCW